MKKFWKMRDESDMNRIPNSVAIAIIIAAVSLAVSIGVMRWSWLLLNEQISLRDSLNELKFRQSQVETQYDFWLSQLQKEREAIQK